jgi:hypothetical protein
MKQKGIFQGWMNRALILCLPALLINFLLAVAYYNTTGKVASLLVTLFTIILTCVGAVLLIHFTDVASSFFGKAIAESRYRLERGLASLGVVLLCLLLVFLMVATLSRLGDFTGGDAILMSVEIPIVGLVILSRLQRQRISRE